MSLVLFLRESCVVMCVPLSPHLSLTAPAHRVSRREAAPHVKEKEKIEMQSQHLVWYGKVSSYNSPIPFQHVLNVCIYVLARVGVFPSGCG